jgi:DNA helicase-2/ATP-dependent DNA helicase PcrA
VTRAQKRAYLLYTYHRSLFGGNSATRRSRFLEDIPPDLVTRKGLWKEEEKEEEFTPVTALFSKSAAKPLSTLRLEIGDRVYHKMFGDGVVINCSPNKDDQEITVAFEGAGVKRLLLSLAPLEKVEKN